MSERLAFMKRLVDLNASANDRQQFVMTMREVREVVEAVRKIEHDLQQHRAPQSVPRERPYRIHTQRKPTKIGTLQWRYANGALESRWADNGLGQPGNWAPCLNIPTNEAEALVDLMKHPYEPEPTLDDAVRAWLAHTPNTSYLTFDEVENLKARIRAWLDERDPETTAVSTFGNCQCGITMTGHINALVAMGARRAVMKKGDRAGEDLEVLIFPAEVEAEK